jgi:signal transduction protein with GAF and PtsI domain
MAAGEKPHKEQAMDYFTALYDVARVINASLQPTRVLNEIVECVTQAMQVKACSLRLLASRGKTLEMGASFGLSEAYLHKGPILVKESRVDQTALKGSPVWIEDAQTNDHFQYREQAKKEGIRSVLVLPLMVEAKPIGVLRVYSEDVRAFDERDRQFLEAVANLSAIAIDNARHHETLKVKCDLMAAHKYRIDDN